jgi:hypothetical protein
MQNPTGILNGTSHPFRELGSRRSRALGEVESGGRSGISLCLAGQLIVDHGPDLLSVLAQPQPNRQLQGNIGSENAATTSSGHARPQPGTAENALYPDSTVSPLRQTEHVEQNEEENGRRAETTAPRQIVSETAAGKKRAESQPDGDVGGEAGMCVDDDDVMCVDDDGKSTEVHAPRYDTPFNPVSPLSRWVFNLIRH